MTMNMLTDFFQKVRFFFFIDAQKMLSGTFLLENMHHQLLRKCVEFNSGK